MRSRFLAASCLSLFMLFGAASKAVTYVYFHNNTTVDFAVSVVQYGTHIMSPGEWLGYNGIMGAWETDKEVRWTNRDQGVHDGDDFYFDVRLAAGGDTVKLRVKLNGNFTGSDMWQSASGPGFSHAWFMDTDVFHSETFNMGGKTYRLKYAAEFTGGDDDIRYALEETNPWPVLGGGDNAIDVLAYNVYMLTPPIAYTDQAERGAIIPSHIAGYDALMLSEVFYNSVRDSILMPGLQANYPYHTAVVDAGGTPEDGGVMIFSKWPILSSTFIVYDSCDGDDCFAAKGAMYAKIDKNGVPYHLFATHTQAWQTGVQVRQAQFTQLRGFINALNIPSNEAVLVGGDLNVDKILNNQNEYTMMFNLLGAGVPRYQGNTFTYDPDLNLYASGVDYEYLDYVLHLTDHLRPSTDSLNEVRIFRGQEDDLWGIYDLSDHFGVYGHFVFPTGVAGVEAGQGPALEMAAVPNPFQAHSQLVFSLPEACDVRLRLFAADGRLVRELVDAWTGAGPHSIGVPDAVRLPAGVYVAVLEAGGMVASERIVKLR